MSFLAELSQHLKTDVADIARASVDPEFARDLTEKQFRREEREEIREADQKQIAEERVRQEEAATLQRKSAAQMKILNGAFEFGRESGDFSELINVMGSENLIPEVREFGALLVESQPGQSMDSIIKNQNLKNSVRRLDQQEKSLLLQNKRIESNEERFAQEFAFKQARLAYDQSRELARQNLDVTNVQALMDSIQTTDTGIWTQDEKDQWIMAMGAADPKQALKIYDRAWTQYNQKQNLLMSQRKAADAANDAITVPPSASDRSLAQAFIIENMEGGEEFFKELTDAQKIGLVEFVAGEAKVLARNNRGTTLADHLPAAFEKARQGLTVNDRGLFGNDTADFSISDAVDPNVRVFNPETGQLE